MAQWPINTFIPVKYLMYYDGPKEGGIETQRKMLIDNILSRLHNPELRQFTFEEILKNADIVESNGATR